jgi:hypothetical protein
LQHIQLGFGDEIKYRVKIDHCSFLQFRHDC